jgi:hypothetical protein
VRDEARLFSPATIEIARQRIEEIHADLGCDLLIDTVRAAPRDTVGLDDARQRNAFFTVWAEKRARDAGVEGVYVLICLDPPHIQEMVTPTGRGRFTEQDRLRLHRLLVERLDRLDLAHRGTVRGFAHRLRWGSQDPQGIADQGLLDAVAFVRRRLEANRPVEAGVLVTALSILGAVLGAWLVLGVVRARLIARGRHGPHGEGLPGVAVEGLSGAVLGGAFGAVAGTWLYRRLFPGSLPPDRQEPAPVAAAGVAPGADQGTQKPGDLTHAPPAAGWGVYRKD